MYAMDGVLLALSYVIIIVVKWYGCANAVCWTQKWYIYIDAYKYTERACVCACRFCFFFFSGLLKCQVFYYSMNNITRIYFVCVYEQHDNDDNDDDVDATQKKNEAGVKRWISYIYIIMVVLMMLDFLEIIFIYFSIEIRSKSMSVFFILHYNRWGSKKQQTAHFVFYLRFLF